MNGRHHNRRPCRPLTPGLERAITIVLTIAIVMAILLALALLAVVTK